MRHFFWYERRKKNPIAFNWNNEYEKINFEFQKILWQKKSTNNFDRTKH